jgi:hypothetical protein
LNFLRDAIAMRDYDSQPAVGKPTSGPLQLLEPVAVLASVAGSVAVAFGQNVAFAALPMGASLGLNFMNRRRLEQLNLQNSQETLNQVQLVSNQLLYLQDRAGQPVSGGANSDGSGVAPQLESNLAGITSTMQQLQERLTILEMTQPEQPQQYGASALLADPAQPHLVPEQLTDEINRRLEPLEQRFDAFTAYMEQGAPAPAAAFAEGDANGIETLKLQMQVQYAELEASVNHALEQLQQLPASDKLEQWSSSLAQLTQSFDTAQTRLTAIETTQANLGDLAQASPQVDPSTYQAQMQSLLSPFENKLQGLEAAFATVSHAPQGLGELEPQLRQLMEQVETHLNQVNAKLAEVGTALPASVNAQAQQFEQYQLGKLSELQQHLQSLELRLDMSLSDVKAQVDQIPQLVERQVGEQRLSPLQPNVGAATSGNATSEDLESLDALLQELG